MSEASFENIEQEEETHHVTTEENDAGEVLVNNSYRVEDSEFTTDDEVWVRNVIQDLLLWHHPIHSALWLAVFFLVFFLVKFSDYSIFSS